jgi:hypothetical protein
MSTLARSSCRKFSVSIHKSINMKVNKHMATQQTSEFAPTMYVSPKYLAIRWQCSRSSVDRIARSAGFTRCCFGKGRNGMVRYLRKEVEAYEAGRRVATN